MISAIMSGFVASASASWIHRLGRNATGWILALIPLGIFIYFASFLNRIGAGETVRVAYNWVPSLNVNLTFYLDGLGLTFALLISGIGALVVVYGSSYLAGHPQLGRFYTYVLMFMAAMLGVVLADNLITFFVFWELTGIASYLLIGFKHDYESSRAAALQAFLVTLGGGLALMAGLVLLAVIGGSWELTELFNQAAVIQAHPLYVPALVLILLGAFTKSAQFPFHFWLPNAMAAPTPVSAYLHSATMVKAGVYLVARFSPILGGTMIWFYGVTAVGAITMVLGAYLAWQKTDLKQILAYTTISALGTLTMLVGIGTPTAIKAAMVFLVVHALYKGALFMAAGAVDHETGTREIDQLGGLARIMPFTAVATGIAALSMAGLPPLFGFIGKELIYEATLGAPLWVIILTTAAVITKLLTLVAAAQVAILPFFGPKKETPQKPHEAPLGMWLGPVLLAGLGLVFGLGPTLIQSLVGAGVEGILLTASEVKLYLIPSEFSTKVGLSIFTIVAGIVVYFVRRPILTVLRPPTDTVSRVGPERWYEWSLQGLVQVANWQTRILQNGYLRYYIVIILATTVGLLSYTLLSRVDFLLPAVYTEVRPHEALVALTVVLAALAAVATNSRLAAVAALGVIGFGVALLYILFNAPDLAMTQLAIETLTVILLVLVLYRLPRFESHTGPVARLRDALIAGVSGLIMMAVVLVISALPTPSLLTPYFAENSWNLAQGRNVVNVILVDFRALDTMGEIVVLAVAAIGVFALLKLRADREDQGEVS